MSIRMLSWTLGIPVLYAGLIGMARSMGLWSGHTIKGDRRSHVMAFEIVSGLCCTYLFTTGAYFALFHPEYTHMRREPLFARSEFVENHLLLPMLVYQTYNALTGLCLAEFRGHIMLVHHLLTLALAYLSFTPYVQYSAVFFFGVTEITNIPLTIGDVYKFFPEYKIVFPNLYMGSKWLFYALFIIVRMVIWPVVSFEFWRVSIHLLINEAAPSPAMTIFFLVTHVLMTILQIVWGIRIIRLIANAFDVCRTKCN
jgi:hypothetical protein